MAKIIAFPGKSCCIRAGDKPAKIHVAHSCNPLLVNSASKQIDAPCIRPIWKARRRSIVVSVIVPARGNPGLLNRCLASLTRQSLPYFQYEIIVVDSAPSSASRTVVENHLNQPGSKPCIIYLPVDIRTGAAAARNHGWQIARGVIIAFTEEGTIPSTDWLKQGLHAFDGIKQAVSGTILTTVPAVPTEQEREMKTLESAEFASFNCFCLRRILEDLGGFDERFGNAGCDDTDFYLRLLEANAAIGEAPLAVVEYPINGMHWDSSLVQQKNTQFEALLHKKHPCMKDRKVRHPMPWHYPVIVTTLLGIAVALALHNRQTLLLATCGWTLLTIHLCLQRLRDTEKSAANILWIMWTSLVLPPLGVFWRTVGVLRFRIAIP